MVYLPLMTAAIAPGIALLAYFYLKDRYDAEPIKMVVKLFLLGVIVVFPTMIMQRGLDLALGAHPFIYSFGISGFVEEFFKWFIIYLMIYSHSEFDEPYDGIVYAVSISLGFATLENVFYALYNHTEIMTLLWRAFLPVSGHALFGVVMGYYLGKAKFAPGNEKKYLALSLIFPVIWHGAFDYILISSKMYWVWFIIPFMILLWGRSILKVNHANANSPFRRVRNEKSIKMISNGQ